MDSVRVHAPATVSNVVCGFDCLGFVLSEPYDEIMVSRREEPGIAITHKDDFGLPCDPEQNVAGIALSAMLAALDADHGFAIEMTKNIRPGSGIGSSAASACGAVAAADHLIGNRFTKLELARFAMEGEMAASGARHADNIAPCMFGGFTLVRSTDPLDIVSIEHPPLFVTVIHPQIEIKTAEARAILPKEVRLSSAIRQWCDVGALVAGLSQGDIRLISRSLEDHIVEPVRRHLIPKFDEVKRASIDAGAMGGGISGSGPAMFMLSDSEAAAKAVAEAMRGVYSSTGIEYNIHVSGIEAHGVRLAG